MTERPFDMPKNGSWEVRGGWVVRRLRLLAILARRRCHNALYRPPSLQPFNEGCSGDPNPPRRFGKSHRFVSPIDVDIASPVGGLLLARCPYNIPGFISLAVVDPLQGIAIRAHAYFFCKILKAVYPFVTYCDSSTAVVPVVSSPRVEATIFHPPPYPIDIRPSLPMSEVCGGCAITLQTTAAAGTTGIAPAKIVMPKIPLIPAIAKTNPAPSSAARRRFRNHLQPTKSFADHAGVLL